MAMITYPLNNVEYTAEDAELYNATRTSGVWSGADFNFSVTGNDNIVTVEEGLAWIRNSKFSGKVVAHKETEDFDFGISDPSYPRIDVLAIRFDAVENSSALVIKKGVASSNPEIPERSTTENLYELYLFSVLRPSGSSVIIENNITDLRDNENYCGYMHDSIKEGYAPSLMEQNKGENFRFWVGLKAEYEEQKTKLPINTFCVLTDEVDPIQRIEEELATKAPMGYGLGNSQLIRWSEINNVTNPGWYHINNSFEISGTSYSNGYMFVSAYGSGTSHAAQMLYPVSTLRTRLIRFKRSGSWSEWEWENPPMKRNVEYRTTERYNEVTIFTKQISFPAAEYYRYDSFSGQGFSIIRYSARTDTGVLPYKIREDNYFQNLDIRPEGYVEYTQGKSTSGGTVYLQIWYYKK